MVVRSRLVVLRAARTRCRRLLRLAGEQTSCAAARRDGGKIDRLLITAPCDDPIAARMEPAARWETARRRRHAGDRLEGGPSVLDGRAAHQPSRVGVPWFAEHFA